MGHSESISLENLNILLIGRTGVGKSTLINNIFGEIIAKEGNGLPCTKEITAYTKEDFHLTLYDTPSLGITQNFIAKFKNTIFNIIDEQSKTKDANKLIHCIWFCIDSNTNKIDEFEKEFISLFKNIPVIIVLTKSTNQNKTNELMREIELHKMNIKFIVPILAKEIDNEAQFGIENLINFTVNSLPQDMHPLYSYTYLKFKKQIYSYANCDPNLKKINSIIIGKIGAGKSTLINTIIGAEVAYTGVGKPVTKEVKEYGDEKSDFNLFDTPGLELNESQNNKLKKNILKIINDRSKTNDKNKFIHCIWYCVRCDSKRIEKYEIDFINTLHEEIKSRKIPIIFVLTQSYDDDDTKIMIDTIEKCKMNIKRISPIVAKEVTLDEYKPPKIIKPYGVEELKSFTYQAASNNYVSAKTISKINNIKDDVKDLKKINVVITGFPNSGRKELVYSFLGNELIRSADPNFRGIIKLESDKSYFNFLYTPEFDKNKAKQVRIREKITNLIQYRLDMDDFKERVHCIWYCIPCQLQLFDDEEMNLVKEFAQIIDNYKIPIIFVLTQCNDNDIKDDMITKISENYSFINYYQPIFTENGNHNENDLNDLSNLNNSALSDFFVINDLDNNVRNEYNNIMNKMEKINIIAIGKSGVGKSTLINNFFRGHLAATGVGVPVTQRITPLTTPNSPLTIYDTPGFELEAKQQNELKKDINNLIQNGYETDDINKHIHCIWYCISAESGRYEESEIQFIRDLTKTTSLHQIPIFIILTQSYRLSVAKDMKKLIEAENLNICKIIMLVAETKKNGNSILEPFGMDELGLEMTENLPPALLLSFNNAQIASIELKRKYSERVIIGFIASAAVFGASPIPFSDCLFLTGIEAAMLSSIAAIYNVDLKSEFISTFLSCSLRSISAPLIGRTFAANILKCIPIVGSITGGIMGGVTGAAFTAALGSTFILVVDAILIKRIDPNTITKKELQKFISPLLNKELDKAKNKEEQNNEEKK